jgi:phosphohistidine phosphatase
MKTLLLLRHAKAVREAPGGDVERPLAAEGEDAADRMGRFLGAAKVAPALLITSPAVRARQTLQRVAAAAGWTAVEQLVRPLYEVTPAAVLNELRLLPADAESALLVGHQPTWSEVAVRLTGGGALRLTTGAVACIGLDVHRWGEIAPGRGELLWLLSPKLLAGTGSETR